jgi:NAD(P)H-hydrate repair Nnr-like enzyme with NAD(P)H-hydrate dehydratase domain
MYVHGLAGDISAAVRGQDGMTALDLAHALPQAWQALRA